MSQNLDILFISLAILALIYLFLTFNVISNRRRKQVLYGAQGDILLQSAMRAHSNFIEYVPITYLLFAGLIYYGVPIIFFCILNFIFIVSRVLHAVGLIKYEPHATPNIKPRFFGMLGTVSVMACSIVYILYGAAVS